MTEITEEEMFIENDFVYISVEVKPAYEIINSVDPAVKRPQADMELKNLRENTPAICNSSAIVLQVFLVLKRHVQYNKIFFWLGLTLQMKSHDTNT